ncbi:hypothetical protein JL720_11973 [Aureococcus anophagefferens]|nr:hypothetical protein JL720_11973 [Aureococcus anophagefferens]
MLREAGFTADDLRRQASHELCSRGDTLLTRAARLGHMEAATTLLDLGADLEWPTRATDLSPLQVACHCGHAQGRKRVIQVRFNMSHADLVAYFLRRGASITRRNNRGLSAVSTAVHTPDVRCLDILAHAGADLASRGLARGNTLAQSAASRGNLNALAYLASRGVNLFERDFRGLCSLDAAAKQRNAVNGAGPNATLDFLYEVLRVGGSAASIAWTRHGCPSMGMADCPEEAGALPATPTEDAKAQQKFRQLKAYTRDLLKSHDRTVQQLEETRAALERCRGDLACERATSEDLARELEERTRTTSSACGLRPAAGGPEHTAPDDDATTTPQRRDITRALRRLARRGGAGDRDEESDPSDDDFGSDGGGPRRRCPRAGARRAAILEGAGAAAPAPARPPPAPPAPDRGATAADAAQRARGPRRGLRRGGAGPESHGCDGKFLASLPHRELDETLADLGFDRLMRRRIYFDLDLDLALLDAPNKEPG